ncbi:uncharacterized protein LOC127720346 [Mytilus californianus]|uniref:uncharacterized protein LOC127720346 n=1 Tax=Mytilus californianus TaxID=6549 RepID=UPI0022459082|nr:uncharacterized protein LOC127720346 [Mytilus californianus]
MKNKQDNKANFTFQKNGIRSEVQKVRKIINTHLDKLQTNVLNKLDNEEKNQMNIIDSFIEKISEMHKNVNQIVNDLKQIKQYASDFQAFLGIHEWNKKIEAEEKDFMSFQTDQIMDTVDIHIAFSPILLKFEKDVKELGKLEVKFSSSKKIRLKKEKQGQILVPVSHTVDNIELTEIRSFQTPDGESSLTLITGIDMFDDGRIVLADNNTVNNRLVIMNPDGQFLKNINLHDKCFGVAVIDKDTVATTLTNQLKIDIVDVNSSNVQRSIPTCYTCFGIHYTAEQLVVNLNKKTIQFFDLSGNTLLTLSTSNNSSNCSLFNDKLYYTTSKSDNVYSTELNGETRWKFDCQKSDYPSGITNDASGNIFVACRNSHQVMVLGEEGKTSRILLTNENSLQKPRAIHYDRKNNFLFVCNISGQCFVYKVT